MTIKYKYFKYFPSGRAETVDARLWYPEGIWLYVLKDRIMYGSSNDLFFVL